jgi:Flagellar protein FliT
MDHNIDTHWQHIIKFSEDLIQMAESSRWEEMPEIATQRDGLIKIFFNDNPVTTDNSEKLNKFLEDLLKIDSKIISLTQKAQTSLSGEMNKFRKNVSAAEAYNNCP